MIVAGARLGPGAVAGDHSLIRERVVLEAGAVVGSGSGIGPGCRIGAGSRIMPGALMALDTVIEEGVFCGPRLIVTNDPAMGRQGPGVVHPVTTLRRGCRIAANVTLLPGRRDRRGGGGRRELAGHAQRAAAHRRGRYAGARRARAAEPTRHTR